MWDSTEEQEGKMNLKENLGAGCMEHGVGGGRMSKTTFRFLPSSEGVVGTLLDGEQVRGEMTLTGLKWMGFGLGFLTVFLV